MKLVDRVDEGVRVARRCEATSNRCEPVGQIGERRLGHAGSGKEEQSAQPLQTFPCTVHAAMALRRGRKRAVTDLKLGEGHLPYSLAHRHCRIETIGHKAPRRPPVHPSLMILGRWVRGQVPFPCGSSVDKVRHGAVAASQFCARSSGSWLVTRSLTTATESAPAASTTGALSAVLAPS